MSIVKMGKNLFINPLVEIYLLLELVENRKQANYLIAQFLNYADFLDKWTLVTLASINSIEY